MLKQQQVPAAQLRWHACIARRKACAAVSSGSARNAGEQASAALEGIALGAELRHGNSRPMGFRALFSHTRSA